MNPNSSPELIPITLRNLLAILVGIHHAAVAPLVPCTLGSLPANLWLTILPAVPLVTRYIPPVWTFPALLLLIFTIHTHPLLSLVLLWSALGPLAPTLSHILIAYFCTYCRAFTVHVPLLSIAFTLLIYSSHTLASYRQTLLTPPKKRRRKPSYPILRTPYRFLLLFLLLLPFLQYVLPLPLKLLPEPPAGYSILAQTKSKTGLISVVHVKNSYRLLTADLSVLGGLHKRPGYVEDSIFSQFHVHEAVRLVKKTKRSGRTLCIGLGIGVVARAFHQLGHQTDVVEIDPVVVKYAREYFGFSGPQVYTMDATKFSGKRYEFIIHDVFTGCAVPAALFTPAFWNRTAEMLNPSGVLAVNFVGSLDNQASAAAVALIHDRLQDIFGHVQLFSDGLESVTHNFVFFASRKAITFREPTKADYLESGIRRDALQNFQKYPIPRSTLGSTSSADWVLHRAQWHTCRHHITLMHELHTRELWRALQAHHLKSN